MGGSLRGEKDQIPFQSPPLLLCLSGNPAPRSLLSPLCSLEPAGVDLAPQACSLHPVPRAKASTAAAAPFAERAIPSPWWAGGLVLVTPAGWTLDHTIQSGPEVYCPLPQATIPTLPNNYKSKKNACPLSPFTPEKCYNL